jgi:hypothetical protein
MSKRLLLRNSMVIFSVVSFQLMPCTAVWKIVRLSTRGPKAAGRRLRPWSMVRQEVALK